MRADPRLMNSRLADRFGRHKALKGNKIEECFGVALEGQTAMREKVRPCAGTRTVDYQGNAFNLQPKDTCTARLLGGS